MILPPATQFVTYSIDDHIATITFKNSASPSELVKACGVKLRRVARAVRELERKGFHLAGLLVPLTHQTLLAQGFDNKWCVNLCVAITACGWMADLARLRIDIVRRNWPMRSILRENEHTQLTGGCYFSMGCALCIGMCVCTCVCGCIRVCG